MSEHTPCPWHVDFDADGAVIHNGVTIASVPIDASAWQFNARLIAAAPDLLAVLQQVAKDFDEFDEEQPSIFIERMMANWFDAKCAIEKATGGGK